MFHYVIYGLYIESDYQLPLLTETAYSKNIAIDVCIKEGIIPDSYKENAGLSYTYDPKNSFLSNSACYMLISEGNSIIYEKKEHPLLQYLDSYLMGWGLATICHQRGSLALHGSCLYKNNTAVMLSGHSGSGKSTVTTALLNRGYEFMADDMAGIWVSEEGIPTASSAFPYQKLCRDIASSQAIPLDELTYIDETKDKFLFPRKDCFHEGTAPLGALIILGTHQGPEVISSEITGINKWYACMDSLFLKGLLQDKVSLPQIAQPCLKLASACKVYQILRPIEGDSKKEITDLIEQYLSEA